MLPILGIIEMEDVVLLREISQQLIITLLLHSTSFEVYLLMYGSTCKYRVFGGEHGNAALVVDRMGANRNLVSKSLSKTGTGL